MADTIKSTAKFMSDPWGMGKSFTGGLAESLGLSNEGQIDAAQATLDDILAKATATSQANRGIYGNYLNQMQDMYGAGSEAYSDAVQNVADAIANRKDFKYTGSVEDFLDPARQQRVDSAMSAINNASSSGGNRFSSSYLDKLSAKQQALASEEWSKAYDKLMQDRQQQLQQWQTGQSQINNLTNLANLYGNDRTAMANALGDYATAMAGQNTADLSSYSNVAGQKASLETERNSGVGALLGGAGKVIAGMFGG